MDKLKFRQHLDEATKSLIEFTKSQCYNNFSEHCQYTITPNSIITDNVVDNLNSTEKAVLKTLHQYEGRLLTMDEVIELLHHDNKVPVWIDTRVYEAKPDLSIINLLCSDHLREEKELMHEGLPPFNLQVAIPPYHLKEEIDGKFNVNWQKKFHDKQKEKSIITWLKRIFLK